MGFPGGADGKEPVCQAGDRRDAGLIPGSGRSSGEGNGCPLQYSCLENSRDRRAWWVLVLGSQRAGHDWAIEWSTSPWKVALASFIVSYLFPTPWKLWMCSLTGSFYFSGRSYKWNHKIHNPFCLASFTYHNDFETQPFVACVSSSLFSIVG